MADFTSNQLIEFIDRAGKATWAGGGKPEANPERPGFIELVYSEGDWIYRDSFTGFYRSRGMEVVRYKGIPVWSALYGGGMVSGKDDLTEETFRFLKQAMSTDQEGFISFRGPHMYSEGAWVYTYTQEGTVEEFQGFEEISHKGQVAFFHRMIGGMIRNIS